MKDDRGDLDLTKQLETQEKELKTLNDVVAGSKSILLQATNNTNTITETITTKVLQIIFVYFLCIGWQKIIMDIATSL